MAAAEGYFDKNSSSGSRAPNAQAPANTASPSTPQRPIPSTFSSPSVSYRTEEEAIVLEIGARHLSAGFAGEPQPRHTYWFGPDQSRRVGDYRQWLPENYPRVRKRRRLDTWGDDHELWQMDLRSLDLGTVQDKIERGSRDIYDKHLLLDSKSRKVHMVLPTVIPHQLLATILSTLFESFQMPTITLLSPAITSSAAAGCRSILHVDIGWRESIVTAVYDFRIVRSKSSDRAMKWLTKRLAAILGSRGTSVDLQMQASSRDGSAADPVSLALGDVEEILSRLMWCQPKQSSMKLDDISIPNPSKPREQIEMRAADLAAAAEHVLILDSDLARMQDDHELPLPHLVYGCLLSLPPDVRATCMSRIVFTGGGSRIAGLRGRIMEELADIVDKQGWSPIRGKYSDSKSQRKATQEGQDTQEPPLNTHTPASAEPQVSNEIDEKFRNEREKRASQNLNGQLRCVESMGPWAGASLIASLHVHGTVEIDRDAFLQHGLAGARSEVEHPNQNTRKSYGGDLSRPALTEKANWTLGAWA